MTITSDSYFYGASPPVYPSPNMTGVGPWAISFNKAAALVQNMTLEERVSLTTGVSAPNGCSGNIPAIARLNFTGLCLSDAGNGLRNTDFVSSWPSGIHVGASWNRDLAQQRAEGMGAEFKKKGVNVLLGPVVGPIGRTVRSGRYWEGISVDPYLSGALVYETVIGSQQAGVITSTKHFIGNEQETNRQPEGSVQSVSSNIDDRTMHELYLWPFQDAVYAGTGNIMCSYNRVNNSYGCANSKTLNGLLKEELGFQGFVVSDWGAQHAGVATALAGMDMAMATSDFWGDNLVEAVRNGSVPEARVTDMAVRIVATWYQMGQDKGFPMPGIGMPSDLTKPHDVVDGRNKSSKKTLLEGAIEGHVLLKNTNSALPLKKPQFLSIFGYSAKTPDQNDFAAGDTTAWSFGTESANATDTTHAFGGRRPQAPLGIAPNGTLFSGGGSGATSQTLVSSPFDAISQRAWADDTQLFWDFYSVDPNVNGASDACLVFVNAWASEGFDRPAIQDDFTDSLVTNVANKCSNTIVVIHNAGTRVVDGWIEHPNVTGLIFAHLPGQYSGQALVSILYGEANPSGKLPYTVAKDATDYGGMLDPAEAMGIYKYFPQADFTEGVFIDYRHFDANSIEPRFAFGYGLSYTTFSYGNLSVTKANSTGSNSSTLFGRYPTGAVRQGGQADLWDELVTVTANVSNTGKMAGAEVAQLYITLPGAGTGSSNNGSSSSSLDGTPIRQLRGFDKSFLNVSSSSTVSFALTRRDLSIWDVDAQKWLLQAGNYTVSVGGSSRNLPLVGSFTIS
ncbi:glycoside hydrolase family 3 protein [Ophiostoma piceae UAMH 11346]|uniref:beta-glucosidase n=1 Tax=Ophiostoma piceae (strain UAMH 11346) TaxID=1262450 RepID=S3C196_OPHP1|nr:glycoside hydrolase family 3 protein [Ophiostoma piceae UAMH 11346]